MKIINNILIVVVLFCSDLVGQNDTALLGRYTKKNDFGSVILNLNKDHRYDLFLHFDLTPQIRYGSWKVKGKKIVLKRDRPKFYHKSHYRQSFCVRDSLYDNMHIYVYDYYKRPVFDKTEQIKI